MQTGPMDLRRKLCRLWIELDRSIMPPLCPFCRTRLRIRERGLCAPCREDLPWNSPSCPRCAMPLGTVASADETSECARCQAHPPPFHRVLAPFRFEFPVDAGLRWLKFRRQLEFVPVFADAMTMSMRQAFSSRSRPELLAPVPLHFLRHGWRGYNQAELLARRISRRSGIAVQGDTARVRRTRSQTGLDSKARRDNLVGAFHVGANLEGRHVMIVDDVFTTGATALEFASSLEEAGANEISVLVAARRVPSGGGA